MERQNVVLQDRILELEDKARQRERQQAKQIQEMKNAYEQQNRRLSEFVDFVKRYFPYVEKMIPTIKFLRETLNFGDAIIRKLCTFKDVPIKGELYSREFNQHFKQRKGAPVGASSAPSLPPLLRSLCSSVRPANAGRTRPRRLSFQSLCHGSSPDI